MNGSSLRVRHRAPTIGWRREQRWRSQSSNAQFTQSVSATNNNQVHLGDRLHRAITWEQQHAVAPPRALFRAQARASLDTEASATLAGKSAQRQRRPSNARSVRVCIARKQRSSPTGLRTVGVHRPRSDFSVLSQTAPFARAPSATRPIV